jgi:hypothetical protein
VERGLEAFVARTGADELMLASQIYDHGARLRSYELAAGASGPRQQPIEPSVDIDGSPLSGNRYARR